MLSMGFTDPVLTADIEVLRSGLARHLTVARGIVAGRATDGDRHWTPVEDEPRPPFA
jgi:hypothetical protein